MNTIDIIINARIEEAVAKGIGPAAHMISHCLGKCIDPDEDSTFVFHDITYQLGISSNNTYISISSPTFLESKRGTVFRQNNNKVELFIPGEWEKLFFLLLDKAIERHRELALAAAEAAESNKKEQEKNLRSFWKL